MDIKEEMKAYRERWQAVEEIERQELRALTIEQHWQQINHLFRFALEQGFVLHDNRDEEIVFERWAKLRGNI
ncbi:MAG: hypothetical protein RBS68_14530 [Anaerolineales bacterium]|jgi:hypothetical protein|nr:hypothetical protein [Anaerolineales bacterium]